jgi:hypothetical protein
MSFVDFSAGVTSVGDELMVHKWLIHLVSV